MDVKRAADLYTQGRTLRQIGAELGVHWSTVSHQLQSAGITMRRSGPSAHPAGDRVRDVVAVPDHDVLGVKAGVAAGVGAWGVVIPTQSAI